MQQLSGEAAAKVWFTWDETERENDKANISSCKSCVRSRKKVLMWNLSPLNLKSEISVEPVYSIQSFFFAFNTKLPIMAILA